VLSGQGADNHKAAELLTFTLTLPSPASGEGISRQGRGIF